MEKQRNYQRELDGLLAELQKENRAPALLLHSCCAPCSSYVLEYLSNYFRITVFYYNPNIDPPEEYRKRAAEQQNFIARLPVKYPVRFLEGEYVPQDYYAAVKGLEQEPEGGARCRKCFRLRLEKTAAAAVREQADYFATTLTISPLKNARAINEIGEALAEEYHLLWLPSDFKKKEGFKRSGELSRQYGLYRQNYCGCRFSLPQERI